MLANGKSMLQVGCSGPTDRGEVFFHRVRSLQHQDLGKKPMAGVATQRTVLGGDDGGGWHGQGPVQGQQVSWSGD